MIHRLAAWCATGRPWWGLWGALAVCLALFQWPGSPASGTALAQVHGGKAFDERRDGYDLRTAQALLDGYGAEGRRLYVAYRLVDLVFPAVYTLLALGLLWRGVSALGAAWSHLLWLPPALWVVDMAENLALWWMWWQWPALDGATVALASGLTQGKQGLVVLLSWAVLTVVAARAWQGWRRRRTQN